MRRSGVGFGKRLEHNLQLINGIAHITESVHRPVLAGVSRKSFIGHITVNQLNLGCLAPLAQW